MNIEKKIRTFIALKPPEDWINALAETISELKRDLRSKEIKWVQPEQIHITLRFLGYILPDQVAAVQRALNEIAPSPFILRPAVLACFPSVRRPRVLWLGVEDPQKGTARLQGEVNQKTCEIGEAPETREFVPHLTLARIKHLERSQTAVLEDALKKPARIVSDWRVAEVLLMQSHLSSGGARYEVLHASCIETKSS